MYRKEYTERKHVIDFLFPLALFFALAASSVALVVLASGSYSRQVHTSEDSYASCTALSYVTEKLHQADSSDAIDSGTFDGQDAILIRQEYSGQSYVTYLYAYDGYLRELFIKEGVAASPGDGRERAAGNLQEYIMKRTPAKRSSLFLLELIIAILFFSLTSAVCVQFFARAHQISRQTQELNAALEKVSGCTEIFLAGGDFTDIFGDRISCTRQPDGSADYTLCYDSSWQLCTHADAAYTLQIRIQPSGRLLHGCFTASRLKSNTPDENPVIYSTETDYCPVPGKGGA